MERERISAFCERVYATYHKREFIAPDPLQVVLEYPEEDREIVSLLASAFALGRVDGIISAVRGILSRISRSGSGIRDALCNLSVTECTELCEGFVYRFFDARQVSGLLLAISRAIGEFGSLEGLFASNVSLKCSVDERAVAGLGAMVDWLRASADGALDKSIMLARPEKGSACKRLLLFLRWMVRSDAVDPGGWTVLSPAELMIPVDTHMQSVGRAFGVPVGRHPSIRSSYRLTQFFRELVPDDPVRYDFSLTRLGIYPGINKDAFLTSEGFTAGSDFATFEHRNLQ
jgi:uncharacterized protein (TIGR02757 family)